MKTLKRVPENKEKSIDCLLIGHYEMECERHLENAEKTSRGDETFRELALNLIYHKGKPYYGSDILNLFCSETANSLGPFYRPWEGMSLAIAYLGTYLTGKGFTFDYVNSFQDQKTQLARKLEEENIRLIAVTTTYYVSYLPIIEILRFVRKYNRTAKIVVGGPFVHNQVFSLPSAEALHALFEIIAADIYVNSSQGEATLARILDALKGDRPLEQIPNLYYKAGSGYLSTPVRLENNRLAENLVDWRLFAREKPTYVNVRTAISCPFKCAFCGFRVRAGKYQRLEVGQIETELNRLNGIESVKTVQFIDDTINTPARRFEDLLKMMIRNKYRFKWISWMRCENINEETAKLMKESGCIGVLLGLETGSNRMLKNMNKGTTVEAYYKGIEYLKRANILTNGSFILGFPGETRETAAETLRFIEQSGIDYYGSNIWFLEPFSAIMQEKEKYGITGSQYKWSHKTMDSEQAIKIKEQAFLDVKNAVHMPVIQFHFQNVLHLISKGMRPETLKSFLTHFNQGIAERMTGVSHNISPGVAEALRKDSLAALRECSDDPGNSEESPGQKPGLTGKATQALSNVDFDL
jgi:anaerobic magnesium-protoporphyrin IX monomethyl ester cyclase